jgi:hypothetical protein
MTLLHNVHCRQLILMPLLCFLPLTFPLNLGLQSSFLSSFAHFFDALFGFGDFPSQTACLLLSLPTCSLFRGPPGGFLFCLLARCFGMALSFSNLMAQTIRVGCSTLAGFLLLTSTAGVFSRALPLLFRFSLKPGSLFLFTLAGFLFGPFADFFEALVRFGYFERKLTGFFFSFLARRLFFASLTSLFDASLRLFDFLREPASFLFSFASGCFFCDAQFRFFLCSLPRLFNPLLSFGNFTRKAFSFGSRQLSSRIFLAAQSSCLFRALTRLFGLGFEARF